jgi:hypothetical protein
VFVRKLSKNLSVKSHPDVLRRRATINLGQVGAVKNQPTFLKMHKLTTQKPREDFFLQKV